MPHIEAAEFFIPTTADYTVLPRFLSTAPGVYQQCPPSGNSSGDTKPMRTPRRAPARTDMGIHTRCSKHKILFCEKILIKAE